MSEKTGWVVTPVVAYQRPDDITKTVVVFTGAPGVSLDGKTEGEYAVMLEMGGQGGLFLSQEGIVSDFMEV